MIKKTQLIISLNIIAIFNVHNFQSIFKHKSIKHRPFKKIKRMKIIKKI